MVELPPELAGQSQPTGVGQQTQSPAELLATIATKDEQGNLDPTEDFLITLVGLTDGKGILDDAFAPPSVEDQADLASEADPREFLSRDEMETLLAKFEKVPQDVQQVLMDALQKESPAIFQRVQAAIRLLRGKESVVGV